MLLLSARHLLGRPAAPKTGFSVMISLGIVALLAGFALDGWSHWRSGLRPQVSGYASMVYANLALQLQIAGAVVVIAAFAIARMIAGRLTVVRRVVFDNLLLFWAYAIGQGLFGLLLTHGFPRLVTS